MARCDDATIESHGLFAFDDTAMLDKLRANRAGAVARYGGQWDVPVGTPVAGRGRPEIENLAGFFLNSLVLRCDLAAGMTFEQAVARVRTVATAAFDHAELPFERLVDELEPVRDRSCTPLYQAAFDLQEEGTTSVVAGDAAAREAFERAWRVAKTDLTLFMWRAPDGSLTGAFEFATSVFDHDTVRRLADHFTALLRAAVADPSTPLSSLRFLTEVEERQLLRGDWNATAVQRPDVSVLDLFEARAAADPAAVALVSGDLTIRYGELDARANQIAHQLRVAGVGPGAVVGVLLERGAHVITAMLGAWKARAAYLPLDPSHPADRIADTLAAANVPLVVTDSRLAARCDTATLMVDSHALVGSCAST